DAWHGLPAHEPQYSAANGSSTPGILRPPMAVRRSMNRAAEMNHGRRAGGRLDLDVHGTIRLVGLADEQRHVHSMAHVALWTFASDNLERTRTRALGIKAHSQERQVPRHRLCPALLLLPHLDRCWPSSVITAQAIYEANPLVFRNGTGIHNAPRLGTSGVR